MRRTRQGAGLALSPAHCVCGPDLRCSCPPTRTTPTWPRSPTRVKGHDAGTSPRHPRCRRRQHDHQQPRAFRLRQHTARRPSGPEHQHAGTEPRKRGTCASWSSVHPVSPGLKIAPLVRW